MLHRFAFVAPNYHPVTCGIGDHSMRLAAELQRRGHQASILTHAPAAPHPAEPTVPVHGIASSDPGGIADGIARFIEQQDFTDVVLQYSPRMWNASRFGSLALPLLAARVRDGRRIWLIAHELVTPWSRRPDLAAAAVTSRLQLAAILGSCHGAFVTTASRLPVLAAALDPARNPLPLGVLRVGSNAWPVERRSGAPAAPRIGLFSTLAFGKRFDVVVSAFERIWARHPQAELIVMGDLGAPSTPAHQSLRAQIDASPAGRRIHLTGKISLQEVAAQVATLSVYLFPMNTGANSRSSTLPIAFASGVPVVAIDGIETDPIFEDRRNVLFASALNAGAFADAALELLNDAGLSERLSDGGRRLFDDHLSWERIGDTFLQALR